MSNLSHNLKKYNYYSGLLGQSKVMTNKDQKMVAYKVQKYKNALMKGGANIVTIDNMGKSSEDTINEIINSVNDLVNAPMNGGNTEINSNKTKMFGGTLGQVINDFENIVNEKKLEDLVKYDSINVNTR
jgi:hypothetical protein